MKTIVITSYDMTHFWGAGIFQTTIAYATAFQKLGYNVKMLIANGKPMSELKHDVEDKLVWLGMEYISIPDLDKLDQIDYMIYMGASDISIKEGGAGLYDNVKGRFPDCKIIYASFYNIIAGLLDGITDDSGYLAAPFTTFSDTFDEVWILESHDFGYTSFLEKTYKKIRIMPLLVFEVADYIQDYHNNKIPPVELLDLKYDYSSSDKNVFLNLDPNSKFKNTFFAITGALDWLREVPGRHIAVGNAFPLWIASDKVKHEKIHDYFKKYMQYTLTASEYINMMKQQDESLIWFYDRHPAANILKRTKPFAVVITAVINFFERWNVLLMDMIRMGVPIIHNFPDINVGWKYEFPNADSLDKAIRQCQQDLSTPDGYDSYQKDARILFNKLASFEYNRTKIEALLG